MSTHFILAVVMLAPSSGAALRDVPAGHWAAKAVQEVVSRGILTAPAGKFNGDRSVTRRELTMAMAQFAKSLLDRKWIAASSKAAPGPAKTARNTVSRYELAGTFARIAPSASAGLPEARDKQFYGSVVFPRTAKVKAKPEEPAYSAAQYLAKEHLAFGDSVALAPGPAPVTPSEVKKAMSQVLVGLVDRLTDEPQNREEIAPPTRHK